MDTITYLADNDTHSVLFEADGWEEAENICRDNNWTLVGEYIKDVLCPAEVFAQLEKNMLDPVLH